MHNFYPSLVDECERLKAAEVPAGFGGPIPDTPEAKAARRQAEIAKGKDVPRL